MAKKTFEEFKVKKEKHKLKRKKINQDIKSIRSFEDAEEYLEKEEDKYFDEDEL